MDSFKQDHDKAKTQIIAIFHALLASIQDVKARVTIAKELQDDLQSAISQYNNEAEDKKLDVVSLAKETG